MSERKKEYQAGGRTTRADQPMSMTLRRVDWARIAVALRLVSKQIGSAEDLRLARVIGAALRDEPQDEFDAGLTKVVELAERIAPMLDVEAGEDEQD